MNQMWHHVVFTYSSNIFDLFVDGKLLQSKRLQRQHMPVFSINDEITIGDAYRNMKGWVIKDMSYYYSPLTLFKIVNEYNAKKINLG